MHVEGTFVGTQRYNNRQDLRILVEVEYKTPIYLDMRVHYEDGFLEFLAPQRASRLFCFWGLGSLSAILFLYSYGATGFRDQIGPK